MSDEASTHSENVLEPGGDGKQPITCPRCKGTGIGFLNFREEYRYEFRCGMCGGSGSYSDALAHLLAGTVSTGIISIEERERLESASINFDHH